MSASAMLAPAAEFLDPSFPSSEELDDTRLGLVADFNRRISDKELTFEDAPCLCGHAEFREVSRYDRYRIRQTTVICTHCGLMQGMPRMSADDYADFYRTDLYRRIYNPDVMDMTETVYRTYVDKHRYRFEFAERLGVTAPGTSVLEIGCAGGWNLVPFAEMGADVMGVDFSPHLTAYGRGLGLDLREGSHGDLPARRFDLIILSHVVEHFLNPVEELAAIKSFLSDRGRLVIEVPNADEFCLATLQNAHTYYFTPPTFAHYMARAGLAMEAFERQGSHMIGLFAAAETSDLPPLAGEADRISRIVRTYARREGFKRMLARFGILGAVRKLKRTMSGSVAA